MKKAVKKAMKKAMKAIKKGEESEEESSESGSESAAEDASDESAGSGSEASSSNDGKVSKKSAAKGKKRKAQSGSEDDSGEEDGSDESDAASDDEDEKPRGKKARSGPAPLSKEQLGEAKRKRRVFDMLQKQLKAIKEKAKAKNKEIKAAQKDMAGSERVLNAMDRVRKQKSVKSFKNARLRVVGLKQKLAEAKNKTKQGGQLKERAHKKLDDCEKEYKKLKKDDYHLTHQGFECQRRLKIAKAEYDKVKKQEDGALSVPDLEERYQQAKTKFDTMREKRAASQGKAGAKAMKKKGK